MTRWRLSRDHRRHDVVELADITAHHFDLIAEMAEIERCGLMSMQTISSPRCASNGTSRLPINPVPPAIKVVIAVPPVWPS